MLKQWLKLFGIVLIFSPLAFSSNLYIGKCLLPYAIQNESPSPKTPIACLKGRAFFDAAGGVGHNESFGTQQLDSYLGAHWHTLSLHSRFYLFSKSSAYPIEIIKLIRTTDLMALQWGNLSLTNWQLIIGKHQLPFSINRPFIEGFYHLLNHDEFWPNSQPAISILYDNFSSFRFEMGASSQLKQEPEYTNKNDTLTTRLNWDLPILGGTRIVGSGLALRSGQRSYGLAIMNLQQDQSTFYIEWIRSHLTPDRKIGNFSQIIRIAYQTSPLQKISNKIIYDDIRNDSRIAVWQQVFSWSDHLKNHISVIYLNKENSLKKIKWFIGTGISSYL